MEPVAPLQATLDRINTLRVNNEPLNHFAQVRYNDGFRKHLGASLIGNDCTRATYYNFHWMTYPQASGQMQRLFNRGHREEARFIEYLQGIGFAVWDIDPATGKQYRVSRVNGHFGGSLDSVLRPPPHLALPDGILFLGEYKTKATGSGFTKLKSDGIMLTNGQHYDQMCTYGANMGFEYAMYFSVNKNDDQLHVEVVKLDWNRAAEVERKAEYIIGLDKPPPKISLQDTHFKCKMCEFIAVCHHNALPAKNCRSCVYSRPIQDAKWQCIGYGIILTDEQIATGCRDQWTPIK